MGRRILTVIIAVAFVALAMGLSQSVSAVSEQKLPSKSAKGCLKCHEYDKQDNVLAGKLKDVSRKAKTIALQIGKNLEVVHFDDATVLENAPTFKKIPKNESVKIIYTKKAGKTYAKEVVVKKGLEVPKEKLISAEEVAKLVAQGPEKGKYVLLDSRPGKNYDEGHIPTAKKMPFFKFDKFKDKLLPKDKDALQIYYCGGFT
jgi:hypothetical protein